MQKSKENIFPFQFFYPELILTEYELFEADCDRFFLRPISLIVF